MKKTTQLFAGLLMLTGVLSACSPAGNEGFMRRVETDFRHKQELLPRGDLFGIFDEPMTRQEREAMMFLYAYMPVGDMTDYPGDFYLENVRSALAARRKAEAQAQMAIEREALLHRFRAASNVFAALAAVALVYALVFRPIDTPPKTYAAPERAERAEHVRSVDPADALNLSAYEIGTAIRMQDGWLYAAAKLPKAGVLMRMQPDGSGMNEVLDVAGGEITDLSLIHI